MTIFAMVGLSLGISLGNYVYLIKALIEITGFDFQLVTLGIYAFMFVLLLIIIEPEKLRNLAFFLAVCIFGSAIALSSSNLYNFFSKDTSKIEYNYFEFNSSGLLVGVALYAVESISMIISSKIFEFLDFGIF